MSLAPARRALLPLAALAALLASALPRPAAAQTKADAFAGKIPPVSGQLYVKRGRFELTPTGNLSLNDAFFSKYFAGVKLGYHFTESLALSAHATAGMTSKTGSAVVCPQNSGCRPATDEMMFQVPGRIRGIAGLEAAWSPIYGKLNVFAERVAHFDLSLLAGADAILHDEVLSSNEAPVAVAAGREPDTVVAYGGHVGLGARLFLAEWIALRLEVKDYVYAVDVPNNGGTDLQNQIFTELGVSFFLPLRNRNRP
jgi:outer membrane beta-barrel protein